MVEVKAASVKNDNVVAVVRTTEVLRRQKWAIDALIRRSLQVQWRGRQLLDTHTLHCRYLELWLKKPSKLRSDSQGQVLKMLNEGKRREMGRKRWKQGRNKEDKMVRRRWWDELGEIFVELTFSF